jgi:hypothetical protein
MKKFSSVVLLSLAPLLASAPAVAGVAEAAKSASSAANNVGNKADNMIRRGISRGNQSAENATRSADGPVDRAAKKIGIPRGPTKPVNTERGTTTP